MKRKAKSQPTHSGLAVVNPNAAAIDIGATMHMAAVGADRASDRCAVLGLSLLICIGWLIGLRNVGSRRSSWNRPASTGSRFLNCSTSAALR